LRPAWNPEKRVKPCIVKLALLFPIIQTAKHSLFLSSSRDLGDPGYYRIGCQYISSSVDETTGLAGWLRFTIASEPCWKSQGDFWGLDELAKYTRYQWNLKEHRDKAISFFLDRVPKLEGWFVNLTRWGSWCLCLSVFLTRGDKTGVALRYEHAR
jgi:hypothetical protein